MSKVKRVPTVYFIPAGIDYRDMSVSLLYVLDHNRFRFLRSYTTQQLVGMRFACCAADDCHDLLEYMRAVGEALRGKGIFGFVCDTSDRHKNFHSNAIRQFEEMYALNADELKEQLSFFMLDGINGNYELVHKNKSGAEVHLSGELPNLDGLIVFTKPGTTELCPLAGAVWTVGATLASKRGKISQLTMNKPVVDYGRCYACKRCVRECPVKAISMDGRHPVINEKKCIDCGRCVEVARLCGISYSWNATREYFCRQMLLHAEGVSEILRNKMIFVSSIADQEGRQLGTLVSRDPVAIDAAALELGMFSGDGNDHLMDASRQLLADADELNIGTSDYRLEAVSY